MSTSAMVSLNQLYKANTCIEKNIEYLTLELPLSVLYIGFAVMSQWAVVSIYRCNIFLQPIVHILNSARLYGCDCPPTASFGYIDWRGERTMSGECSMLRHIYSTTITIKGNHPPWQNIKWMIHTCSP